MGLGMGFTMMPTFSGAMQTLRRASISRASTTLNITQQVSASIGTAVLTVLLVRIMTGKLEAVFHSLGGAAPVSKGGGLSGLFSLPPAVRGKVLPAVADSFGQTFIWALALVLIAFVVALVLLPKHQLEPVEEIEGESASPAMMVG